MLWLIIGIRNKLLIKLPENIFKLRRFGKVKILKNKDINSIKNKIKR